jgi:uncharacterized membrane protein YuzA (DUF378 family)
MNIFIAMALAAAALNIISAVLLIYAAINVRKVSRLNVEIMQRLTGQKIDL